MPDSFDVRGVVEGFYGPPWSFDARRRAVDVLAPRGMNAYVYAPKDDEYHRARWRDPYPEATRRRLADFHGACSASGVRFGFALSPGLDIDYAHPADRAAVWDKIAPLADAGVSWFVLAFDDVPLRSGSGAAQRDLTAWLIERTSGARISIVPTDYVGTRPSGYLDDLTDGLVDAVDLFWTGSGVVPSRISAAEAAERRASTGGCPVLVWDNYPVNDAFMDASLHLGPLRGRDGNLASECAGYLANPMVQPLASLVPLATAMDYARDPAGYDPATSWESALHDVATVLGGGASGEAAMRALCRACAASRLTEESDVPLHGLVDALERGDDGAAGALDEELAAAVRIAGALPPGVEEESGPWVAQIRREAEAGLAALRVLTRAGGRRPDQAEGPDRDAWSAVMADMGMIFAWLGARTAGGHVAFGQRFACYPAIVQGPDGQVRVDGAEAVVEDANAVDRLCRLALAHGGAP